MLNREMVRTGIWGLLIALAFTCTAVARAEVIATDRYAEGLSAARGMAVWSASDFTGQEWRLRLYAHGVTRTLHARPRKQPFDVQLGVDLRGHTVAVYSRCRKDTGYLYTTEGCTLYEFRIGTGRETRLRRPPSRAFSEFLPAIDRGRIAYFRVNTNSVRPKPKLLVYDSESGRSLSPPTPPRGDYELSGDGYYFGPVPNRLELRGDRLAFLWQPLDLDCQDKLGDYITADGIWVLSLTGDPPVVIGGTCSYSGLLTNPTLTSSGLIFRGYTEGTTPYPVLKRFDLKTGAVTTAPDYRALGSTDGDERLLFGTSQAGRSTAIERSTPRFVSPERSAYLVGWGFVATSLPSAHTRNVSSPTLIQAER